MTYDIQKGSYTTIKVGLIWNLIALVLNYILVPYTSYYNGNTGTEALAMLLVLLVLTLPLFIADVILYKKVKDNPTRNLLIIATVLAVLSVAFLIKLASLLLAITYIRIMIKDKVDTDKL